MTDTTSNSCNAEVCNALNIASNTGSLDMFFVIIFPFLRFSSHMICIYFGAARQIHSNRGKLVDHMSVARGLTYSR